MPSVMMRAIAARIRTKSKANPFSFRSVFISVAQVFRFDDDVVHLPAVVPVIAGEVKGSPVPLRSHDYTVVRMGVGIIPLPYLRQDIDADLLQLGADRIHSEGRTVIILDEGGFRACCLLYTSDA